MQDMEKTRLEDLFMNNYRSQGLAEKKPETQEIVLVKRIKLGVRSVKVLGWIGSKESNRSRGFSRKGQDTKDRTKITRKSMGLIAKRPYLLPFDRADRGKPGEAAALVAGGAGAPASWGLGWRVQGLEKIVGSSETRSPRSENGRKLAGGGPPRQSTATVASELDSAAVRALRGWESRRRRLGH
jgi:hypothetical protein